MASKAKLAMTVQRRKTVAKYAELRKELKEAIRDPKTSMQDKAEAQARLQSLPRDASPTRIVNRCFLTGRPRAYYRKFGLSRIAVRDMGLAGHIPGLTKSSW